jgi:putative redox protein
MAVTIELKWQESLKFTVETGSGRVVELNSTETMGNAFTPMELFLFAVAGCTAMDVSWILERERQKVEKFEISARGTRREEDPKYYETIDLEYRIKGKEIRKDAVERAIRLSQDEYCSVRAMINQKVKLNISFKIQNADGTEQAYNYSNPTT